MRLASAEPAEIEATLVRLDDMATEVVTFDLARDREWQDVLSESGAGGFVLQNDDPDLGDIVGDGNDLVIMRYKGQAAWTMICESYKRASVDQAEEAAEATRWSGRGHLALWERMALYPSRGVGAKPVEEDRHFDWTASVFDDSNWKPPKVVCLQITAALYWNHNSPAALLSGGAATNWDAEFDDNTASVLWAANGAIVGAVTPGIVLGRHDFTVSTLGNYRIAALNDNVGDYYLDGQFLGSVGSLERNGYSEQTEWTVELSPGPHLLAMKVTNTDHGSPANTYNPAGFAFAVSRIDSSGAVVSTITHSDSSTKILPYPASLPGMTPTEVVRVFLNEAVARCVPGTFDVAPLLSLAFTDTTDSAGQPVPTQADISSRVGTDGLTFLRELAGTYLDVWMDPTTLTLYAWNIGARGTTTAVDLHAPTDPTDPLSGNLTMLTHEGET